MAAKPPTLDDILERVHISQDQLNQECTNEDLTNISLFLSWRVIAPHLGLQPLDIDEIESKREESERRLKMLQIWKAKYGYKANFEMIVTALLKIDNAYDAEKVCKVCKDRFTDSINSKSHDSQDLNIIQAIDDIRKTLEEFNFTEIVPFPEEEIRYLLYMEKHHAQRDVKATGVHYEISEKNQSVKLVGKPESRKSASEAIKNILEKRQETCVSLEIPEHVCWDYLKQYMPVCEEDKRVSIACKEERSLMISSDDEKKSKDVAEWIPEALYSFALDFKLKGGWYVQCPLLMDRRTEVTLTPITNEHCEAYLQKPRDVLSKYYALQLPSSHDRKNVRISSGQYDDIRWKLEAQLKELERYQSLLRVGYEARFGYTVWAVRPSNAQKMFKLEDFMFPNTPKHKAPIFHAGLDINSSLAKKRVSTDIRMVIGKYCSQQTSTAKLLDPLKVQFHGKDGRKLVAVVEELPNRLFSLYNIFFQQNSALKIDVIFPERTETVQTVRICPTYEASLKLPDGMPQSADSLMYGPSVQKYHRDMYDAVESLVKKIRRRPSDKALLMPVKGNNFHVCYLRQKKQTQHLWKDKNWVLAKYEVEEFEMTESDAEKYEVNVVVPIKFKNSKREVELWNRKEYGSFSCNDPPSKELCANVQPVVKTFFPGDESPTEGTPWTADQLMSDFEEFFNTALDISAMLQ